MSNFLWLHGLQHTRLFCSPLSTRICSISCTLNLWYLTISSSSVPFSSCLQSFPASESSNELALPIKWPKYWSFSFNISLFNDNPGFMFYRMDWFDFSRVFCSTTIQKHQFFSTQLSLLTNSHICTWVQEKKHKFDYVHLCQKSDVSAF